MRGDSVNSDRKASGISLRYRERAGRIIDHVIGWAAQNNYRIPEHFTKDWEGRPVVHDRMHWTLAEAINTSAVLYRMTGNKRYADDYAMFMEYLDTTVLDHSCGSWFHQLDDVNRLKETVWPGKPDLYHAFQAMLIPYSVPGVSVARAVYDRVSPG